MAFDRKNYHKQYQKENREQIKERMKQYYIDNRIYLREYNKQWKKDNPKNIRNGELRRKYNLSYENLLSMWDVQDGKCAICGEEFKNSSDAFVDHNHETNEIRGLLCRQCNLGIGFFKDNSELTMNATKYLVRNKT